MAKKLIYNDVDSQFNLGLEYYQEKDNLLYLVPYHEIKVRMREQLLEESNQQAIIVDDIVYIQRLWQDLYYKVIGDYQIIEDSQVKYILQEVLSNGEYKYFNLDAIDKLLYFIKKITGEKVNLSKTKIDDPVLKEISTINYDLNNKLKQLGFITKLEAYCQLEEELTAKDLFYLYPDIKNVFIDKPEINNQVELDLILKLANCVEDITVLLDYNYDLKQTDRLGNNLEAIVAAFKQEDFIIDDIADSNQLINQIFNNQIKEEKLSWQDCFANKLTVIKNQNKVEELKRVAYQIRRLSEAGVNLSKIKIAFGQSDQYLPYLPQIFANYEISYNQVIPAPLISNSIIKFLMQLLSLIKDDFEVEDLCAIIDSNFLSLGVEEELITSLEKIMKKVRSNNTGWQLVDDFKQIVTDKDRLEVISIEQQDEVVKFLNLLEDNLKINLETKIEFTELIAKLTEILNNLEFQVDKDNQDLVAAWEKFRGYMKDLSQVYSQPKSVIKWIEIIEERLEEGNYKLPAKQGVKVSGELKSRPSNYDYLFLVGMNHNQFPISNSKLLASLLEKAGVNVEDDESKYRYLFSKNILSAEKELFITYSKASNEDEAFPTSYLNELYRVIDQESVEQINSTENYQKDKIYSYQDLQQRLGANLKEDKLTEVKDYEALKELVTKFKLVSARNIEEYDKYQGLLSNSNNLNWLQEKFDSDFNYSASLLEDYVKCPFQFLANRIFGWKEVEYNEEMHAFERGNLLHEIVQEFYDKLNENQVVEGNKEEADQLLLNIVQEKLKNDKFKDNLYWQVEGERYLQRGRLGPVFDKFLDMELSNKFHRYIKLDDFEVKDTEWSFENLELIEGYKFKGKVDRIDYNPIEEQLGIIEYKSGNVDDKKLENNPIQIPLYVLAVEAEFNGEVIFGSYYGLKPEDRFGHKKVMPSDDIYNMEKLLQSECFKEDLEESKEEIKAAIEGIKKGKFLINDADNCKYCQLEILCRKGEF